jgi:hypothetical protein
VGRRISIFQVNLSQSRERFGRVAGEGLAVCSNAFPRLPLPLISIVLEQTSEKGLTPGTLQTSPLLHISV